MDISNNFLRFLRDQVTVNKINVAVNKARGNIESNDPPAIIDSNKTAPIKIFLYLSPIVRGGDLLADANSIMESAEIRISQARAAPRVPHLFEKNHKSKRKKGSSIK